MKWNNSKNARSRAPLEDVAEYEAGALDIAELSVGTVHALNNLLTAVFAASSYLEDFPDSESTERAKKVLMGAIQAGQSLASGLFLLGLSKESLENVRGQRARRISLSGEDLRWILKAVEGSAEIQAESDILSMAERPSPLEPDTLKALLFSMIVAVSQSTGGASEIFCRSSLVGVSTIRFEVSLKNVEEAKVVPKWYARHPCVFAIDWIADLLPAIGCRFIREATSCTLELDFLRSE